MPTIRQVLTESSLSRVYRHNEDHDCGTITAFRGNFSFKENVQRNKSLVNKLLRKRYSVTKISGRYIEDTNNPVVEKSFFVVDMENRGTLENDLNELGKEFGQESILFIPKGTIKGDSKAYFLYPTGQKIYFNGNGKFGYSDSVYISYVNGRPFYMDKIDEEFEVPQTNNGRFIVHTYSNTLWINFKIDEWDIKRFA